MEPEHIYYNATIIDNETKDKGINNNPLAQFKESRSSSLIENPSHYDFTINRFSMNGVGKSIPIFIPLIETGQTDINKTIYKITLELIKTGTGAGTYEETLNITYQPQIQSPTPSQPLIKQDLTSHYYYVYSYDFFTGLINDALSIAVDNIKTAVIAAGGTLLTSKKPFLRYNELNNRFEIYGNTFSFGQDKTSSDETFKIYFNTNLFMLISGFLHTYNGHIGDKN